MRELTVDQDVDTRPPRVRLYEPPVHFFIVGFTMLWSFVGFWFVPINVYREDGWKGALIAIGVLLGFSAILYRTMWRAKRVHLDNDNLLVGRWLKWRVIPVSSITRVERPGFFKRDLFTPTEVFVRDGRPILFFPVAGAEELLRIRAGIQGDPP